MQQQEEALLRAFRILDAETKETVLLFVKTRAAKMLAQPKLTLVSPNPSSAAYLGRTARKIKN